MLLYFQVIIQEGFHTEGECQCGENCLQAITNAISATNYAGHDVINQFKNCKG